ncbi:unnamed protein product [Urochloa decumbens]|uniref:F-box domain-containing protein n=1 Tax=Urochloa decumbens TaxID=240449 RepID=A0ABC9FN62_9POAL
MPPPPPVLMEELIEEILLRLPPADPVSLTSTRFCRRFREFHRSPSMLGFLCNNYGNRRKHRGPYVSRFVPTSSFHAPACAAHHEWRAFDARHGRILFRYRNMRTLGPIDLFVWDPMTDKRWHLPEKNLLCCGWNVAVLCARTGACDHLDCCSGPFIVRMAPGASRPMLLGPWGPFANRVDVEPTALAGNTLYFQIDYGKRILGYDLATRETSVVQLPPKHEDSSTALITVDDGGLGVARLDKTAKLSLWSMEASTNGDMGWTKFRVIELDKLLSVDPHSIRYNFVGFAHGVGAFIVGTGDWLLSFHLTSGQVRKVCVAETQEEECNDRGICGVIP